MTIISEQASEAASFELRPNCSMGWRATKAVFAGFALLMTLSSVYWVSRGAWLVLPFFGLELLVLGLGLYLSALAGGRRELILIDGPDLRVIHGGRRPREVARFTRYWTRVVLSSDPNGWCQSRLWLACHGRRIEVASALVEQERLELAGALTGQLGPGPAISPHRHAPLLPGVLAPAPQARRESTWQH